MCIRDSGETKKNIGISMLGLQYESNFQQLLTLIRILESLASSDEFTILNKDDFSKSNSIIENERINKIFNYIKINYKDKVCLEEASNLIYMTKPSFCRYFKKHTGIAVKLRRHSDSDSIIYNWAGIITYILAGIINYT